MLRLRSSALALVLAASTFLVQERALGQARFLEGPYVDRLTGETATIHVRTARPTKVRVQFTTPEGQASRESIEGTFHPIVISGFARGTRVEYTVEAEGVPKVRASFLSPRSSTNEPLNFVVLGDSRDGDAIHSRVVGSMRGEPAFVVHVGDYVPRGASDEEWIRYFDSAAPILRRAALVPTLGNHELISEGGRARYFERFANAGPRDTAYQVFDYEGVRFLVLDSNTSIEPGSEQYRFAERELGRAASDGSLRALFVSIHHGPFSSGRHGEFTPLHSGGLLAKMREARVDLIFSGHDHIYERGEHEGLKYIVTGGAGSPLYGTNDQRPYQQAFAAAYHHISVRVDGPNIELQVVRPDGTYLEECSFSRGASFRCEAARPHPLEAGMSRTEDLTQHYWKRALVAGLVLILVVLAFFRMRRP